MQTPQENNRTWKSEQSLHHFESERVVTHKPFKGYIRGTTLIPLPQGGDCWFSMSTQLHSMAIPHLTEEA